MKNIIRLVSAALFIFAALANGSANEPDVGVTIAKFADSKSFSQTQEIITELSSLSNPTVIKTLEALAAGKLRIRKADKIVAISRKKDNGFELQDPVSGKELGYAGHFELKKIKIKNSIRRSISAILSNLNLRSVEPETRDSAARAIFVNSDANALEALEIALAAETNTTIKAVMAEAKASAILGSSRSNKDKLLAIEVIANVGSRQALSILSSYLVKESDPQLDAYTEAAIARLEKKLVIWDVAQNILYGISLGSVLLLAAVGLAITFGVMGVINMAHGEMVMLGAYTTYVVQQVINSVDPGLLDYSLLFALPLGFLVAAIVGLAIERGVIRFLYGRPLETLLATWGISMMLQQAVRTIFGAVNQEVSNPVWMSGAYELGVITLTANRLWIIAFSLVVFAILLWMLKHTSFGLNMRAVTQNRSMASSMGIASP
jgi:urea transport system permease protein